MATDVQQQQMHRERVPVVPQLPQTGEVKAVFQQELPEATDHQVRQDLLKAEVR